MILTDQKLVFEFTGEISYPATPSSLQNITQEIYDNSTCQYIAIIDLTYGFFYYNTKSSLTIITLEFGASQVTTYNAYSDAITVTWLQNDNASKYNMRVQDANNMPFEFNNGYFSIIQYLNWFSAVGCCLNSSSVSIPSGQTISITCNQNTAVNTWQNIQYNYSFPFNVLASGSPVAYQTYNLASPAIPNGNVITLTSPSNSIYEYIIISISSPGLYSTSVSPGNYVSWATSGIVYPNFVSYQPTSFPYITYLVEFLASTSLKVYKSGSLVFTASSVTLNNFSLQFVFSGTPFTSNATITTTFTNSNNDFSFIDPIINSSYYAGRYIDIAAAAIGTSLVVPPTGYTIVELGPPAINTTSIISSFQTLSLACNQGLPFIENYNGSNNINTDANGYFTFILPSCVQGSNAYVPSVFFSVNGVNYNGTAINSSTGTSGTTNNNVYYLSYNGSNPFTGITENLSNSFATAVNNLMGVRYQQYTQSESMQLATFVPDYGYKLKISTANILYYQIFQKNGLINGGQINVSGCSGSWNIYLGFTSTYTPNISYPISGTIDNTIYAISSPFPISTLYNGPGGSGNFSEYQYLTFEQSYTSAYDLSLGGLISQFSQPIVDGNFDFKITLTVDPGYVTMFGMTSDPYYNNTVFKSLEPVPNIQSTLMCYINDNLTVWGPTGNQLFTTTLNNGSSEGLTYYLWEIVGVGGNNIIIRSSDPTNVTGSNQYATSPTTSYLSWVELSSATMNGLCGTTGLSYYPYVCFFSPTTYEVNNAWQFDYPLLPGGMSPIIQTYPFLVYANHNHHSFITQAVTLQFAPDVLTDTSTLWVN